MCEGGGGWEEYKFRGTCCLSVSTKWGGDDTSLVFEPRGPQGNAEYAEVTKFTQLPAGAK